MKYLARSRVCKAGHSEGTESSCCPCPCSLPLPPYRAPPFRRSGLVKGCLSGPHRHMFSLAVYFRISAPLRLCSAGFHGTDAALGHPPPPLAAVCCAGSECRSPRPLFLPCPPVPGEQQPGSWLPAVRQSAGLSFPSASSASSPPCRLPCGRTLFLSHGFWGQELWAQQNVSVAQGLTRLRSRVGPVWEGTVQTHPVAGRIPLFVTLGPKSPLSCWRRPGAAVRSWRPPQPCAPWACARAHTPVTVLQLPGRSGAVAAPGFGSGRNSSRLSLGAWLTPCASCFVSGVESSPHGPGRLHDEPA